MKTNKLAYLLWSMIAGLISFLISGLISCYIIAYLNNYILATIVSGGLGSVIFSILLMLKDKIIKLGFAGMIAMPVGLFVSFGLIEGVAFVFPSLSNLFEGSVLPDVFAVVLLAFVYALIVSLIAYGKKEMLLFALTSEIIAIGFGFMVVALNLNEEINEIVILLLPFLSSLDLNFLTISIGLGTGLGLSHGIYSLSVI